MARVAPLPLEALPEPLSASIERGTATRMLSNTLPVQIWAHRPAAANAWLATMAEIHERGVLPDRLRELVRLKIASITTCPVCQIARKSDDVSEADVVACSDWSDPRFSPSEQAALRFAELFAGDYFSLGNEVYDHLRLHFSEEQIVELHLFSGLMLAGGRMTYVLKGYEDTSA
uniref:carboxymuconolactone decarboxylase family protein n=1 Tax=uncultured Caulobacter sp. TaxID=158749 RepID=UPI0025F66D00|nr:carboxymuconolactone decarboxylase family protein [uncultured Caulobacter sp.]